MTTVVPRAASLTRTRESRLAELEPLLARRILVLDGAMGTMIQSYGLGEQDYRGERFAGWGRDLRGNNDLLSLTQPAIIRAIHTAYLEAGADILETNSFNSTAISMADYGMEELAYELNRASARYRARGGRRVRAACPRDPPLRGRRTGPDQSDRFAFARRERPRFSERALRRARRGIR